MGSGGLGGFCLLAPRVQSGKAGRRASFKFGELLWHKNLAKTNYFFGNGLFHLYCKFDLGWWR